MWLRYGLDVDTMLVAIEDVPSGKTLLACSYCSTGLSAKKGRVKQHHFAHTAETCRAVAHRDRWDIPTLRLYDNFHVRLSGEELGQLKILWSNYGEGYKAPKFLVPRRFVLLNLLQEPEFSSDSSD
jgi:hypothetical protein